jgi:hypothetical protein
MGKDFDYEKAQIVTTEARLSYPKLFTPKAYKDKPNGPKSYSCELLFDKKTTKIEDIKKPVLYAIKHQWGEDKADWPQPLKLPYRDGDKPFGKKKEVKDEHRGMWVVSCSTGEMKPPRLLNKKGKPVTNPAEMYPGCFVRAVLSAKALEEPKQMVKFYLNGLKVERDGKTLGGANVDEAFGIMGGDEDEVADESFDDFDSSSDSDFDGDEATF